MTCIAAYLDEGKIWMGADSGVFVGPYRHTYEIKIDYLPNGGLVGMSGDLYLVQRFSHIMKHDFGWLNVAPFKALTELAWMFSDFRRQNGYPLASSEEDENRTEFIFGIDGQLFVMGQSHEVIAVADFCVAMGYAGEFALGVLKALNHEASPLEPRARLLLAFELAAKSINNVEPPFRIISTE